MVYFHNAASWEVPSHGFFGSNFQKNEGQDLLLKKKTAGNSGSDWMERWDTRVAYRVGDGMVGDGGRGEGHPNAQGKKRIHPHHWGGRD